MEHQRKHRDAFKKRSYLRLRDRGNDFAGGADLIEGRDGEQPVVRLRDVSAAAVGPAGLRRNRMPVSSRSPCFRFFLLLCFLFFLPSHVRIVLVFASILRFICLCFSFLKHLLRPRRCCCFSCCFSTRFGLVCSLFRFAFASILLLLSLLL